MRLIAFLFLSLAAWVSAISTIAAAETAKTNPELLQTAPGDYLYVSDAAFYPAEGQRAVVWVPGRIFNKESWARLAKALQEKGVASIALSGKTENHVRNAIQQLVRRGYKDVILVGGSSGGAAVLNTMEQVSSIDPVSGVIMLSPVRGNPMDDQPVRKLFIVSEDEKLFEKVRSIHGGSMEPKELMIIPGKAHAQFLLFGADAEAVTQRIFDFILK